ncbi:MAG TPA: metallophosphoesterase [Cyclobacteriaceae bacterium]|nr:metallophosphoesterase [Cyclobacteriaceae bacterium]
MGRSFVIGDIHGAYKALKQCIARSGFDYNTDTLYCLGDVCDGWPETRQSIDELLRIKNLIYILGNHDFLALKWMQGGVTEEVWLKQGGEASIQSYDGKPENVPGAHINLLKQAQLYHKLDKKLFVHAGFNPLKPIEEQGADIILWDRQLANMTLDFYRKNIPLPQMDYEEVYIGHTPIGLDPIYHSGIWMMDTGAGWSGVLSMMDIETKEIFQSDLLPSLYPAHEGRKKIIHY